MAAMVWSWDVSTLTAYTVYAAMLATASAVTIIYMHIKQPTFHQVAYALLTALVLLKSMYILHTRVGDRVARRNLWWTILTGVSIFLTGFGLWTIDNEYCDALRSLRSQIGIPWAFALGPILFPCFKSDLMFLELHGWW